MALDNAAITARIDSKMMHPSMPSVEVAFTQLICAQVEGAQRIAPVLGAKPPLWINAARERAMPHLAYEA